MSAAVDYESYMDSVLSVLTDEPKRFRDICDESGVNWPRTGRCLSDLLARDLAQVKWTRNGVRLYLRKQAKPKSLPIVQTEHWRPQTRKDCVHGVRPCPYSGCKYHLYIDLTIGNNPKINFKGKESHEIGESCTLDLADRGGLTLEEVGQAMGITREYVRQLEASALRKLEHNARVLREFHHD